MLSKNHARPVLRAAFTRMNEKIKKGVGASDALEFALDSFIDEITEAFKKSAPKGVFDRTPQHRKTKGPSGA